jgi:hypothetical protein
MNNKDYKYEFLISDDLEKLKNIYNTNFIDIYILECKFCDSTNLELLEWIYNLNKIDFKKIFKNKFLNSDNFELFLWSLSKIKKFHQDFRQDTHQDFILKHTLENKFYNCDDILICKKILENYDYNPKIEILNHKFKYCNNILILQWIYEVLNKTIKCRDGFINWYNTDLKEKFISCNDNIIFEWLYSLHDKRFFNNKFLAKNEYTILEQNFLHSTIKIEHYLNKEIDLMKIYIDNLTLLEYKFLNCNYEECQNYYDLKKMDLTKIYKDELTILEYKYLNCNDEKIYDWINSFNNTTLIECKFLRKFIINDNFNKDYITKNINYKIDISYDNVRYIFNNYKNKKILKWLFDNVSNNIKKFIMRDFSFNIDLEIKIENIDYINFDDKNQNQTIINKNLLILIDSLSQKLNKTEEINKNLLKNIDFLSQKLNKIEEMNKTNNNVFFN